jgi:myosin-5
MNKSYSNPCIIDESDSFTSTSSMDSDFEVPRTLKGLNVWTSNRVSQKVTEYLSSMTSINESETMRYSLVTANKWKKMGYHPYKPDASGYTALHRAAKKGDSSIITTLLAMYDGKQIDLVGMKSTRHGHIALHIAAKYGKMEAVKTLTQPQFRPLLNDRDYNGNTPLHFAATSQSRHAATVVAHLLGKGADPVMKSSNGIFPIIAHLLTTQKDDAEIINLLLKYGSDPNTLDTNGNSVLHIAVSRGLWKIAACLVNQQASLPMRNKDGISVLDMLKPKQLSWLAKFIAHPPEWVPNSEQSSCMICSKKFGMVVRRHHCRLCGRICCGPCSKYKRRLPFVAPGVKDQKIKDALVKVCSTCIAVQPMTDVECEWSEKTAIVPTEDT